MAGEKIGAGEYVFKKLTQKIRNGEYKAGDKLPSETDLAEKYNVSRNTVRSAINKLATLNMVETFQGKGTFVKDVDFSKRIELLVPQLFRDSSDYMTLMNLRLAVESQAAGMAAIRATYEDVRELESIIEELEAHKDDLNYCAVHDITFHMKIVEVSGNQLFCSLIQMIRSMLDDVLADFITEFGNYESIISHRRILDGIKEANQDVTREAMRRHIQTVIDRYVALAKPLRYDESETQ